jgi:predicted lipoprotein with Yx(FWY)xxD motif
MAFSAALASALGLAGVLLPARAADTAQDAVAPQDAAVRRPADGVIGFVLSSRYEGLYETPNGKDECPDGFQPSLIKNYREAYPNEADRVAHDERFAYHANLGPNGENVFFNPTAFKDPLPFKELRGKIAYGLNLDGKVGDQDFVSPDGEPGIDNQLYRVIGCITGFRAKGTASEVTNQHVRIAPYSRLLLELRGVHDVNNDENVEVWIYRGLDLDPVREDSARNAIPWTTQRVDLVSGARFISKLHGRIFNGVLTTEPEDVVLPAAPQTDVAIEMRLRQMRMRIKLTATGAEGLLAGYQNVEEAWRTMTKMWGAGALAEFNAWSPSSTYAALKRYADAYPDAKTGENTEISSAYRVQFTRAFIAHPADSERPITAAVHPPRPAKTPERVIDEPTPKGIRKEYTDYGFTYADERGRTLYTWGTDAPGKSACNGEHIRKIKDNIGNPAIVAEPDRRLTCEQAWPPYAAHADAPVVDKWTVITREDGSKQWAYEGRALYTSDLDRSAGDVNGWGVYGIGNASGRIPLWVKVDVPHEARVERTLAGRVLASVVGLTLYAYDADSAHRSKCEGECTKTWLPFAAPALAHDHGDWSVIARADATHQWVYRGKPLYTNAADKRPGDLSGDNLPGWQIVLIQPLPQPPAEVTLGMTTAGQVLTDQQGRTLYRFLCTEYSADRLNCDAADSSQLYQLTLCGGPEKCRSIWQPLAASKGAHAPNHTWTIVEVDPNSGTFCRNAPRNCTQRVWAYLGRPAYTFAGDTRAGDIEGDQMRTYPYGFAILRPDGRVAP